MSGDQDEHWDRHARKIVDAIARQSPNAAALSSGINDLIDMKRMRPLKKQPTAAQARALQNLIDGKDLFAHVSGLSSSGGANGTRISLCRNGWIEEAQDRRSWVITDVGREIMGRL